MGKPNIRYAPCKNNINCACVLEEKMLRARRRALLEGNSKLFKFNILFEIFITAECLIIQ